MNIKELKEKTPAELERLLKDARNRLRELRFKIEAKQLGDVREVRETRQLIARVLTLQAQSKSPAAGRRKA